MLFYLFVEDVKRMLEVMESNYQAHLQFTANFKRSAAEAKNLFINAQQRISGFQFQNNQLKSKLLRLTVPYVRYVNQAVIKECEGIIETNQ
jgi:hypothetical protein